MPAASPSGAATEKPADPVAQAATPTVPEELAGLASNWDSLPEHIRNAIVSLARA